MAESADDVVVIQRRLSAVQGYENRVNDVFVFGCLNTKQHIIYFGGDIQNYPETMLSHRDNKRYVDWNIEKTAEKISKRFEDSLVFVIKPSSMSLMTFSVYANFWEPSETSSPVHNENFNAVEHLFCLYNSILEQLYSPQHMPSQIPISLIGFSKGCTVLNQFVFELHLLESAEHLKSFVKLIEKFYWLDGGHCGGPGNTWVVEESALKDLASLKCEVFIHVTPYQMKDPMRAWIGKEEAKFYKKLKKLEMNVHQISHFDSLPPSIENHFRILDEF